jgi:hypothetical protein
MYYTSFSHVASFFPFFLSLDKNLQDELRHQLMGTQGVLINPTDEGPYSHPSAYADHRERRASVDYSSEGNSATSHSVPSSAASSSLHLPMEGINIHQQYVRL